jgi:hypothetical protein
MLVVRLAPDNQRLGFGIGAAAAPPDKWTWEGPEPPNRPPGPGTDWTHRGFDEDET